MPRVTAILVARNGADFLERTLSSLSSQTRPPDALVVVDAGSSDSTSAILTSARPTQLVTASAKGSFGASIGQAVHVAVPSGTDDEWIWLLSHDSAPEPRALAALLAAVEIAPSVAIAGPKLMRWDDGDTIARYGETVTRLGASILLVENELDQAQYDSQSDLLAVAAAGMLVRRSVWSALGGFDPGLPTVDAALDFAIRARLAGHRVVGVPSARVASAGGPELFGRRTVSVASITRQHRGAQLHRRMVYAPGLLLPLHWLSLLPVAILRSLWQLVRKQPSAIAGELATAIGTAFSGSIAPARRNLRRTRRLGWGAIAPLRMSSGAARERRINRSSRVHSVTDGPQRTRVGFVSGGGAWVVLLAAVVGVLAFSPLLGASAVTGGALLPLSTTVSELWANVGYGWHDVGGGFIGASDPFAAVLAVLGSLTFWAPSFGIVLFYLVAVPLSALGAWWCATRLSERAWPPAVAALLWAFSPPLLSSMTSGHLGAVVAHVLLPWFVLATLAAARSWSAGAVAALLFAAVTASAPSIAPALVVLLLMWIAVRPMATIRLIGILIPAAALFAPLVVSEFVRGNPLAVFADPGVAAQTGKSTVLQLALGSPNGDLSGWAGSGDLFGLPGLPGPLVAVILLVPFALLSLAGAFLPGTRRSIPSLVIALLGFATAVAATNVSVATIGSHQVAIYAGAGLSLFWFGLVGALVVALDAFGARAALPALVVLIASTLAVAPLIAAPLAGTAAVRASDGSLVPAFVSAEAAQHPGVGTLVLTPESVGALAARVERGTGVTLDDQSTLASTADQLNAGQKSTATLAANLASRSGLDTGAAMKKAKIGFVLLSDAGGDTSGNQTSTATDVRQRAADALDGNSALTPVGDTSLGLLWRYAALPSASIKDATHDGGPLRPVVLAGLGFVFLVTLLLAIPTARRRRGSAVTAGDDERATLGEDDNA